MFGINNYPAFLSAIIIFQLVPGPGTMAILHSVCRGGRRGGMGAVFGTLAGDLVYMTAAVSGLAALLAASPSAFALVRWAGIIYLCRFGWQLLRAATANGYEGQDACAGSAAFRRAFAVGLTNPKVIMFFLSFFPLFMSGSSGAHTLGIMMAHVTMISLGYQALLVLAGYRVARWLNGMERVSLCARRFAGILLIGFGVRLALDNH